MKQLCVDRVTKEFAGRNGTHRVLDSVSLHAEPEEFVTLLGPSGCGKTTLLTIVAGFQEATSGQVTLDGHVLDGPGPDRGFVFQDYALFPWMTVRENVLFPMQQQSMNDADRESRLKELLRLAHLAGREHLYPHQLSGGMKQRTAFVRALASRPEVLLMDEPLGALDYQMRVRLQAELESIFQAERTTILMVTHDVEEAVYLSDRVLVMALHGGEVIADVRIDLERPRQRRSEAYHRYKDELMEALEAAMGSRPLDTDAAIT